MIHREWRTARPLPRSAEKPAAQNALGLKDRIEDILITLGEQYHVIRPLASRDGLFLYLALHRANANLAMARFKLAEIEKGLTF
ncbi:hypothetical protein [Pyxidicoccus parkwayensis]|uniref:hypothetical protein n=1 Tax=Pyxidicoccus parkwayensis TaxID=2813578 RepID=UPI001F50B164|nr:hypothetical protein [Pyxidicoccus parkwaysis]